MKLMHVFAPSDAGGLDRVVEGLAVGHHGMGHRVVVAALTLRRGPQDTPALRRMRAAGVLVHEVPISTRGYMDEWKRLRRLVISEHPDIVHTHGVRTDVIGGSAARRAGVRTVTTLHGRTGGSWSWRLFEWIQYRQSRHFDVVVAVSSAQLAYLESRGIDRARIAVVPNAWTPVGAPMTREEARHRVGVDHAGQVVGWVGRFSFEKGPDLFLAALAQLPRGDLHAVVVGGGPEEAALRRQSARLGLDDRIRWTGIVADAATLFPAFDVFVLSSRSEGTPIVLFESMAAGVPIVATDVGGVSAVVSNGEAFLVPPGDVTALARAIQRALHDRDDALARAHQARRRLLSAYHAQNWLERYLAVYEQALAS